MSDLRRYFGEKWDADNGEELLLRTHDLNENSIVFDVGGYTGEWARAIVDKYDPYMTIFEPVPKFCEVLQRKFKHNPKVKIWQYGLASSDAFSPMVLNGSASRVGPKDGGNETIYEFRDPWFAFPADAKIDLMAINIEGGEYDLLPHLIDTGLITRIRELVIQFHMLWPSCYDQWKAIRAKLNATHGEVWNYPFVWERHDRR